MKKENFGTLSDGRTAALYTIQNGKYSLSITDYGATLVSFLGPDKNGNETDVVLGFDSVSAYENNTACIGSTIGRYANRIGGAEFTLNGVTYTLSKNDGDNNIHGGYKGFGYQFYTLEAYTDNSLTFTYFSRDGEEGFPGNLTFTVCFSLSENGGLAVDYYAVCDKDTLANFTNHAYYNPSGIGEAESNNDLLLTVNATSFCDCDDTCLANGAILSVDNTPFDFRTPKRVGNVLSHIDFEPIKKGKGIDHNFVLSLGKREMKHAMSLYSEKTGIEIQCFTDQAGVQIYSANFLDTIIGKNGHRYGKHGAVCMETQGFPNAPHIDIFPSAVLRKGEEYRRTTVYKFITK